MGGQDNAIPERLQDFEFHYFFRDVDKFTIEHVGQFMAQCCESGQNEYYKVQLFPLSLTRIAFTWYSTLPPNSI